MHEAAIAEVCLDDDRRLFVRPAEGDFEHVYRAAMEVYWDETSRRLSHPRAPLEWTPVRWFQQIIAAVANEYDALLKVTERTVWIGVSADLRSAMRAVDYPNAS